MLPTVRTYWYGTHINPIYYTDAPLPCSLEIVILVNSPCFDVPLYCTTTYACEKSLVTLKKHHHLASEAWIDKICSLKECLLLSFLFFLLLLPFKKKSLLPPPLPPTERPPSYFGRQSLLTPFPSPSPSFLSSPAGLFFLPRLPGHCVFLPSHTAPQLKCKEKYCSSTIKLMVDCRRFTIAEVD